MKSSAPCATAGRPTPGSAATSDRARGARLRTTACLTSWGVGLWTRGWSVRALRGRGQRSRRTSCGFFCGTQRGTESGRPPRCRPPAPRRPGRSTLYRACCGRGCAPFEASPAFGSGDECAGPALLPRKGRGRRAGGLVLGITPHNRSLRRHPLRVRHHPTLEPPRKACRRRPKFALKHPKSGRNG